MLILFYLLGSISSATTITTGCKAKKLSTYSSYYSYYNGCNDFSITGGTCVLKCSLEELIQDAKDEYYSRISIDFDLANDDEGNFQKTTFYGIRINGKIKFQESMFAKCPYLQTVEFTYNSGITSIPASAFKDCSSLYEITLSDKSIPIGVSAFENCKSLTEYTFSKKYYSSQITIPNNAFKGCTKLSKITIPHEEITIGDSAFEGCSSLKSFKEDRSYTKLVIGEAAFRGSGLRKINLRVSNSQGTVLEEIKPYTFYNCQNLEEVSFSGASTTTSELTIGEEAFAECPNLVKIDLMSSGYDSSIINNSPVKTISCYYDAITDLYDLLQANSILSSLESLEFHSVTSLDGIDFQSMSNLKSLKFSGSSLIIPSGKFQNLASLESITVESASTIESSAFSGCSQLTTAELGGITTIEDSVFSGCSSLKELKLQNTIRSIGNNIIDGCAQLETLKLPDNLDTLPTFNFKDQNPNLKTIHLPASLSSLDFTFEGLQYLQSVDLPTSSSCTSIPNNCFKGTPISTINIPDNIQTFSEYAFADCSSLTSINFPSTSYSISAYSFSNCIQLTSITFSGSLLGNIPSTSFEGTPIEEITCSGNNLQFVQFSNFRSLTNVSITDGTEIPSNCFKDCISLQTYSIPSTLTTIGPNAFYNCQSLTEINIPEQITQISSSSFSSCTSATYINIPGSTLYINYDNENSVFCENCNAVETFTSNAVLNGITFGQFPNLQTCSIVVDGSIPDNTFKDCEKLSSFSITGSYSSIGNYAFSNCKLLSSFDPPYTLESIGNNAFENCESLYSIDLSSTSVQEISTSAFHNCFQLNYIYLPSTITTLSARCFANCSISSIELDESSSIYIGDEAFANTNIYSFKITPLRTFGSSVFAHCGLSSVEFSDSVESISSGLFAYSRLTEISIPSSISIIGSSAFSHCTDLNRVDFSNARTNSGLTTISDNAFEYCTHLSSITLPSTLNEIGEKAFYECTSLSSIDIPSNVGEIKSETFSGCSSLSSVTINGDIESVGNNAFSGCEELSTLNYYGSVVPTFEDDHLSKLPSHPQVNVGENYNGQTFGNLQVSKPGGSPDSPDDGGLITVAIVFIVIAVIVVVGAIAGFTIWYLKRKNIIFKNDSNSTQADNTYENSNQVDTNENSNEGDAI